MSDIEALIVRVETATGPDRELDGDIALATYPWPKDDVPGWLTSIRHSWAAQTALLAASGDFPAEITRDTLPKYWADMVDVPAYTGSIDAVARQLTELVLPEWDYAVFRYRHGYLGRVWVPGRIWSRKLQFAHAEKRFEVECREPAISLLLATLRAIKDREADE